LFLREVNIPEGGMAIDYALLWGLMRDAQIATHRAERREICEAVNQPVAGRTDAAKNALCLRFGDVVHHVAGGPLLGVARQAIDFTSAARLLARLLRRQKGPQIAPMNQERSLVHDKGKAGRNPSANGVLMHAQKRRGF
jgi:hypothetical protein